MEVVVVGRREESLPSSHPALCYLPKLSPPTPRVGKITTQPGAEGAGCARLECKKADVPAGSSLSLRGKLHREGPPEDIHLPLLRHPAHNCLASAGVVFSDSAFCVCSFFTWELFLPGHA